MAYVFSQSQTLYSFAIVTLKSLWIYSNHQRTEFQLLSCHTKNVVGLNYRIFLFLSFSFIFSFFLSYINGNKRNQYLTRITWWQNRVIFFFHVYSLNLLAIWRVILPCLRIYIFCNGSFINTGILLLRFAVIWSPRKLFLNVLTDRAFATTD